MAASPSHIAHSDESYQTDARYRSVAVVTLAAADRDDVSAQLGRVLAESGNSESKWLKLRQARERFAATALLDAVLVLVGSGRLRVDTLIWDTYDSRHRVIGRDDVANLQRMYYHLLKNVLQWRWPRGSTWQLLPDENTALDWMSVWDCVDIAGARVQTDGNLFEEPFRLRLRRDFSVLAISEVCSAATPLCQLADLFAGLGAFSHSAFDKCQAWLCAASGQLGLALNMNEPQPELSNRARERFAIMRHLDQVCKTRKLRVGLGSSRGFLTHDPRQPINFWLYQPQRPEDKAPTG